MTRTMTATGHDHRGAARRARRPRERTAAAANARLAAASARLGLTLGVTLLVGLTLVRSARTAAAQPFELLPRLASASFEARAEQLFDEAAKDRDAGVLGQAAHKYRAALLLWDHPIIRYDLALVLIELDQPVEAAEQLEQVIRGGPAGLGGRPSELEHARQKLQDLVEHELVTVRVTCVQHGARVSIDDKHLFTVQHDRSHVDITRVRRVRAGPHTFLAEIPGDEANVAFRRYIGPPGSAVSVQLEERWEHRRRWPRVTWLPGAVIGGGVAAGIAGAALQLAAAAKYRRAQELEEDCMNGCAPEVPREQNNQHEQGHTRRALGIAAYGLSGAILVTGGVLTYLNRSVKHRVKPARRLDARSGGLELAPLAGPGLGGAMVLGRF